MASKRHRRESGGPEPVGAVLTRLRLARGLSQLRLAELLCANAASPTVTRHEVSRWERGERVPGEFWLRWLAVVLEAPLEQLEVAVAAAQRRPPSRPPDPVGLDHRLWRPPTPADLLAALDHARVDDLRELGHAWLAGPAAPPTPVAAIPALGEATASETIDALAARLADLRRMDDLVGGLDLAGRTDRELRAAIAALRTVGDGGGGGGGGLRRRALQVVAGHAQLTGWAYADAGDGPAARRAYRVALHAATAAGDRALAAHVLGGLSHQSLAGGDPREALLLARTGYTGARADGSALTQALLLHRMALANAHLGERRAAERALAEADRLAERSDPEREPDWLYWFDATERSAMAGRCLVVLGRPLRAVRLLVASRRPRAGPRTTALYTIWLARSYLDLGEVEQAGRLALRALRKTVAAGSARVAATLRHLHPRLLRHREVPVVRRYERLAAGSAEYLPERGNRREHGGGKRASVAV